MFDWQQLLVTVIAAAALYVVVKPMVRRRRSDGAGVPSCPSCAAGNACATTRPASAATSNPQVIPLARLQSSPPSAGDRRGG